MIEAVENHNPEVIVIDEIGRELEAQAARTIAERGVQLVATAHGRTLENLLLNPTLSDLIGGIESVTLSDEEARRRGTQKTVLERRAPPTFDVLVEIQERDRLVVHPDVAEAVDELVRGYPLHPEIRSRDADGGIHTEKASTPPVQRQSVQGQRRTFGVEGAPLTPVRGTRRREEVTNGEQYPAEVITLPEIRIYPYGVARNRLLQAAKRMGVPAIITRDPGDAEVLITLRTYYRNRQQVILEAEARGVTIYVLRANTVTQMEQALGELFHLPSGAPVNGDYESAAEQTQAAIQAVLNGQRFVDLPPASPAIRRLQHDLARQAELVSHSYGKDPNRRVRIFKD
jgi:hypothetical protein